MKHILGKRRRRQENGQTWISFFKTAFLGHFYIKNQHIRFLVYGHSAWSTFGLDLARGPKAL